MEHSKEISPAITCPWDVRSLCMKQVLIPWIQSFLHGCLAACQLRAWNYHHQWSIFYSLIAFHIIIRSNNTEIYSSQGSDRSSLRLIGQRPHGRGPGAALDIAPPSIHCFNPIYLQWEQNGRKENRSERDQLGKINHHKTDWKTIAKGRRADERDQDIPSDRSKPLRKIWIYYWPNHTRRGNRLRPDVPSIGETHNPLIDVFTR
jgi:hypothetical protein